MGAWEAALWIVFLARRDDLLELDARRRVHDHVRDYPGLHLSEIARGVDLDVNHVKYHLRVLEKHGIVSSKQDGSYVRFFPKEEGSIGPRETLGVDEKKVVALLRKPHPLHITLRLLNDGPGSATDLAESTGISRTTLLHHLGRMEKDGITTSKREGRSVIWSLVDEAYVERCLLQYRPPDALVQGFLEAWEELVI